MGNGRLFIIGTPIGNLEDITLRALRTLKSVDIIACEDTRRTQKLLNKYEIKKPLISYHKFNEAKRSQQFSKLFSEGKTIALVSDAGMPGISDPGHRVINLAIRNRIDVSVIPGPSSISSALVLSGLPADNFIFCGFLPSKTAARQKKYYELKYEDKTLIFFETGNRLKKSLEDMEKILGNRQIAVVRELTKIHEEVLRNSIQNVRLSIANKNLKGEIVLIVEGNKEKEDWKKIPANEHIEEIMQQLKISKNEAIKLVAKIRGLTRRDLYIQEKIRREAKGTKKHTGL